MSVKAYLYCTNAKPWLCINSVYVSVDDCDDTELPFSDYGKTWALTKEEMEK